MTQQELQQLEWRQANDFTLVSICGRYQITRTPNYDRHPRLDFDYHAKCIADGRRIFSDTGRTFSDSKLAKAACQIDFEQLQQSAASTTKG